MFCWINRWWIWSNHLYSFLCWKFCCQQTQTQMVFGIRCWFVCLPNDFFSSSLNVINLSNIFVSIYNVKYVPYGFLAQSERVGVRVLCNLYTFNSSTVLALIIRLMVFFYLVVVIVVVHVLCVWLWFAVVEYSIRLELERILLTMIPFRFIPIFETGPYVDSGNSIPTNCIGMSYCSSIHSVDDHSSLHGAHMHA